MRNQLAVNLFMLSTLIVSALIVVAIATHNPTIISLAVGGAFKLVVGGLIAHLAGWLA